MRLVLFLPSLVLLGCASSPPMWTPAERLSAASCNAAGDSAAAPWRLVPTPTFTFCVPPNWRTDDGRTWAGDGGTITWGVGTPPARPVVQGDIVVVVPVPPGGGMPSQEAIREAAGSQLPDCRSDRREERIGGQFASVSDAGCNGRHHTEARFDAGVYLEGDTDLDATAALQMNVYRTVRFTSQGAP